MGTYDAILIPGGGVLAGGELPPWVKARLDRALELRGNELLIPLSSGTPHRPPVLDEHGRPLPESLLAARYLLHRGLPASSVLVEAASYDTVGNAWFSRVLHAQPRGLRRLLVVTSAFHLDRCKAVFRWVYRLTPQPHPFELTFESAPDAGVPEDALAARRAREAASLDALRPLIRRHSTVASFHRWLYSEHRAYTADAFTAPPSPPSGPVLDTY